MSHAQYTWSSFFLCFPYSAALILFFYGIILSYPGPIVVLPCQSLTYILSNYLPIKLKFAQNLSKFLHEFFKVLGHWLLTNNCGDDPIHPIPSHQQEKYIK